MNIPLITRAGAELSANAQRIAQIVHDFDDTLELQWIPPHDRSSLGLDTEPYRIVQFHPDYEPYVVMWIREDQLDHRIIEALFKARNFNITDFEAKEAAQRAMKLAARMDEEAEEAAFTKWAIEAPKTVKHNGVVYR